MLKNYLKIAWRNIVKSKLHSFISIIGLTIGLCACMLVATVVIDDLSYDTQWSKSDHLYRILTSNFKSGRNHDKIPQAFAGLGTELQQNFPEVEAVSNIYIQDLDLKLNKLSSDVFKVNAIETDTLIWKLLDFTITSGTPKQFIEGKGNLVISESFRKKYFPTENPVGKILYHLPPYLNEANEYLITGVIKDIPSNTHLRADVILIKPIRKEPLFKEGYGSFSQLYIALKANANISKFTSKVNKWYADYVDVEEPYIYEFQPMKDVYLHSDFAEGQKVKSDFKTIFILCGIALLLLIIACINFINLTTARTVHRMREIGVRKILGAGKRNVVFQFLTESILFFTISTFLGLLLYLVSLPYLEHFLGYSLTLTFVTSQYLFSLIILIILPISLIVGVYPALVISGFKPISAIKGTVGSNKKINGNFVLKSLVVIQFSISITILIVLIIVQQQIQYLGVKDIGYNKDNLVSIDMVSWNGKGNSFKNELLKRPDILDASITKWLPSHGPGSMSMRIEDPNDSDKKISVQIIMGDVDLPKTLGLSLKQGRLLDDSFQADKMPWKGFVFEGKKKNEAPKLLRSSLATAYTAKLLGIHSLNTELKGTNTNTVGIIDNFNNESLKSSLKPTIIVSEDSPKYAGMLVRVNPANKKEALVAIHNLWKEFFPSKVIGLNWVDDLLAQQYKKEANFRQLFVLFSLLSMFLAVLGIFGLIEHAVARRVKEVGIRKVLGASISSIIVLFSKSFLKLVLLAVLIAAPFAWYGADTWLQEFAYKIDIKWWVFAIAGMVTIAIVLMTLIFQTTKAAVVNPVKSLRTE